MNKKARERAILEQFLQFLSYAPIGTIEEGEAPDFVLRGDALRIGIELTGLWETRPGLTAGAQLGQREFLLEGARAEAQSRGLPPLYVTLAFAAADPIPKRRAKGLVAHLVDLVGNAVPAPGESRELCQTYGPSPALPLEIDTIWIDHLANGGQHFWTHIDAGYARSECSSEIQACIDHKGSRCLSYATRCDTCWLVVHCDERPGTSMFTPSPEAIAHVYVSPFSRTFFFGLFTHAPLELTTVADAAGSAPRMWGAADSVVADHAADKTP